MFRYGVSWPLWKPGRSVNSYVLRYLLMEFVKSAVVWLSPFFRMERGGWVEATEPVGGISLVSLLIEIHNERYELANE